MKRKAEFFDSMEIPAPKKRKTDFRRDAKVLIYDLEVSPFVVETYRLYEATVKRVLKPQVLLAMSWKWLGEKETHGLTIYDRPGKDNHDDRNLVWELWKLIDEANIVCAYNGKRFDNKMANTFFLQYNMKRPSPSKPVDPLETARRYFLFGCNKLDYVGKFLNEGKKTEKTYKDCCDALLEGNEKERKQAAKIMNKYCMNDTTLLEKIYQRMLPWMDTHPNMALYAGQQGVCPRCGVNKGFIISKYRRTGAQINGVQYQCKNCGGYVTRPLTKEERETLKDEGKFKPTFRNLGP